MILYQITAHQDKDILTNHRHSYKFSFFPSVIRLWNTLPPFVINSPNLDEFCTNLHNHYDYTCAP